MRLSDGRTGIVRFVGTTHFASGDWVGIELEDDSGKNDGSVQGERYFDCGMGHGMFVRPTTLAIIAQAPATAKPAARRPSRPSSFNPGTGRAATDSGLTKRMSLNAPSPSPGPKGSRPSSGMLRVSVRPVVSAWIKGQMIDMKRPVSDQVTNKTARISYFEWRAITDYYPVKHSHLGCGNKDDATRRIKHANVHGSSADTYHADAAAVDFFSIGEVNRHKANQRPALHDWENSLFYQTTIGRHGRWKVHREWG